VTTSRLSAGIGLAVFVLGLVLLLVSSPPG
jgi:uncharacterized membrane protein YtjA (UPF0391 family)